MEESAEKRRERLQAMRMEASNQSQSLSSSSSVQNLSNPLINSAADERTPQPTRFDFYTDPMAAVSGSKRRNPSVGGSSPYCSPETFSSPIRSHSPLSYSLNRPSAGPRNYHVASPRPPPPGLQFQTNQSPDQSPWRSPMQFPSPPSGHIGGTPASYTPPWRSPPSGHIGGTPASYTPPWRSPMQFPSPPSGHIGGTPASYTPPWRSPPSGHIGGTPASYQPPWRSPMQFPSPPSGHIGGTPASYTPNRNSLNRSGGGSPGHGFPPNYSSRGGVFQSPNFSRRGSSSSPHSNSGRGNGWQFRGSGSSSTPGRGGSRGHCSARYDQQHQFKAMVKDPWRKLKPIVGNILVPRFRSRSWLPKSIAAPKRAKVVESGARSQLSLAESLALSMEEAVNDA